MNCVTTNTENGNFGILMFPQTKEKRLTAVLAYGRRGLLCDML